ncbi:MAG TPA: hypothetical protein VGO22_17065 [Pseudorhizobium sp.]|jgi:hypothetical protein|nr:hypothetical protein [Pseudorhizobium sp.]
MPFVVLYLSLYRETGERRWINATEDLVAEVDRVLGRPYAIALARRQIVTASVSIILPCDKA